MKNLKVKEVYHYLTKTAPVLKSGSSIKEVISLLLRDPFSRSVYIIDDNEFLVGIISTLQLMKLTHLLKGHKTMQKNDIYNAVKISNAKVAGDIMHPPVYVYETDNVFDILDKMIQEDFQELPVVNKDKKVIGDLNCLEIIQGLWEE